MQAKISACNDCRRFPQVTGGNFSAPAGKLGEAFIVPVRSAFFKRKGEKDVSFYPVPNTLTKVTTCFFWSQWWTLQILFRFKKLNCFLLALETLIQKKTARWKSIHYHQNDRELVVVTFSVFSLIPSEGKITSKSRSWSWIALETQCIFDEHYRFFLKKYKIMSKTKKALLFVGEFLLKLSKI